LRDAQGGLAEGVTQPVRREAVKPSPDSTALRAPTSRQRIAGQTLIAATLPASALPRASRPSQETWRTDQFGIGTLRVNAPTHWFGFSGPKLAWHITHAGWKLLRGIERR
jgi:hypothetical protein